MLLIKPNIRIPLWHRTASDKICYSLIWPAYKLNIFIKFVHLAEFTELFNFSAVIN